MTTLLAATPLLLALAQVTATPTAPTNPPPAPSDAIAADWVAIPDDEIIVFTLRGGGAFTMRLASGFAPAHVANIRRLLAAGWWNDNASVYRVQDNFVAQWGDGTEKKALPAGVVPTPAAEHERPGSSAAARLSKADPYAAWAGYSRDGWPLAGDAAAEWLPHCYGMVGVGRSLAPDTGSGAELYAVTGQSPRALDRNIAVVGRIVEGIEQLSVLPRGTGDLGFYATPAERLPIVSARLASELPAAARPKFQYRRVDNPRFAAWIASRENRRNDFYTKPAGGVDICAAMPPVRRAP